MEDWLNERRLPTNHHVDQLWFQPSEELPAEADALKIHIHPAVHFKLLAGNHLHSERGTPFQMRVQSCLEKHKCKRVENANFTLPLMRCRCL